jgi:hypothetical protein
MMPSSSTRNNTLRVFCASLLLVTLSGCATSSGQRESTGSVRWVALVTPTDCCHSQSATHFKQALARHAQIHTVMATSEKIADTNSDRIESRAAEIRSATKRAHTDFLSMRMDSAQKDLQLALRLAQESMAAGLVPEDLARIHLYLAAVSQTQHNNEAFENHCETAVGYFPALKPDPDTFSPPIRDAIERARQLRQAIEANILSEPPDAEVYWDGPKRGHTPIKLQGEAKGEHYLRLEHPLYQPWLEVIRLSPSVALQVKLKPAPPAEIVSILRLRRDLFAPAASLLGVHAVIWLSETAEGLEIETLAAADTHTTRKLDMQSSPETVEQTAVAMVNLLPGNTRAKPAPEPTPAPPEKRSDHDSHWKRYWWAYALAGAAVVAVSVALPLSLSGGNPSGRGVHLELP